MTAEAEIGKLYRGKVVTIKEFGAFVEFLPGKDGWSTSANWPTSVSSKPKTSSSSAMKSGSSAWAWTKRAASASPAKPPWKTAKRKWPPRPKRDALIGMFLTTWRDFRGAHAPPRVVSDALVADIPEWVPRGRATLHARARALPKFRHCHLNPRLTRHP
jgi:hypothetical protein